MSPFMTAANIDCQVLSKHFTGIISLTGKPLKSAVRQTLELSQFQNEKIET